MHKRNRRKPCSLFNAVQLRRRPPTYPGAMTFCAYCRQRATVKIPSIPGRVCFDHALEFWTGLLAYANDHSEGGQRQGTPCTCEACNQRRVTRTAASSKVIAA